MAPISNKVSNGTLGGGAAGIVSALLVYFIPAFHSGIPAPLAPIIPALIGAIGYFGSGFVSKHQATGDEIGRLITQVEQLNELRKVLASVPQVPQVPEVPAEHPAAAGT